MLVSGLRGREPLDLEQYQDSVDTGTLAELVARVGKRPDYDAIDRLDDDPSTSVALRGLIQAIRTSERGLAERGARPTFERGGRKGESQVGVFVRDRAAVPNGKSPLIERIESRLPNTLVGQDVLPSFLRLARRHEAPLYVQRAVMALGGPPGHGKDEAVHGLNQLLNEGQESKSNVLEVDLRNKTPNQLFGPGGALSPESLAEQHGVIRIRNAENLVQTNPALASRLAEFLLSKPGDELPNYPVVFDFGADERTLPQMMAAALGQVGPRVLSAHSRFERLDVEAMKEYAQRALPRILSEGGGYDGVVRITPEALELLGRALATEHEPLYELEARLHNFVVVHFEAATSVDQRSSALEIQIAPKFEGDPKSANALIREALDAEVPDLARGAELFTVYEVGRVGLDDEERDALAGALDFARERLAEAAAGLTAPAEAVEAAGLVSNVVEHLASLAEEVRGRLTARKVNLVGEDSMATMTAEAAQVGSALDAMVETLPLELGVDDLEARQQARGWGRFASDVLAALPALLTNLRAGEGVEPFDMPSEPTFEALPEPPTSLGTPPHVEALRVALGAKRPPPRVQIFRNEQSDGWMIHLDSRLPERDEHGSLAFAATLELSPDQPQETLVVTSNETWGWEILDERLSEIGFEVGRDEIMIAMAGLGYGLLCGLSADTRIDTDREQDTKRWSFNEELEDRAYLDEAMLRSAQEGEGT